jgi:esterase
VGTPSARRLAAKKAARTRCDREEPMNLLRPLDRDLLVNGLRLRVLDWGGEGRTPVVLLHGFTGHAHAWDTLSIALQPHFHVYALDQRGHGDSDPADTYDALSAFDDISGVVDQLGLTSFVLVGLSMGGRNAMYFTSKRPDLVQKLVVVDIGPEISMRAADAAPGPAEPDVWDSTEQAAQHLYRGNRYPGIHYYRWVASHSLRARPDGSLVWAWHPSIKQRRSGADVDWWAVVRGIVPPTLVLRGEESHVLDRDVAERMARELPRGRFVEIPRAVHTLHEDNPEAVLAALKGFLAF